MESTRNSDEKWVVVGAAGGLGRAFIEVLSTQKSIGLGHLLLTSRRAQKIDELKKRVPDGIRTTSWVGDLTRESEVDRFAEEVAEFGPQRVLCLVGGGPFGTFQSKSWKDHQWAFALSFLFPARLLHLALQNKLGQGLSQVVVVGSAIAECRPDPMASSYAASKHALKGLVETIQAERNALDVRLYSPGYMDTPLLPPNAAPRAIAGRVISPGQVAADLLGWLLNSEARNQNRTFSSGF